MNTMNGTIRLLGSLMLLASSPALADPLSFS